METLSVISIFIGIGMMVILCFAKFQTLPSTLVAALVVGILSRLTLEEIFGAYMKGAMNAVAGFFVLIALGGMFGLLMERSGAASKIVNVLMKFVSGRKALYFLMILFALLGSYAGLQAGGVFMMMPLFLQMLQRLDLPRNTLAGLIYSSMGGYCILYPGNVSSINLMPIGELGTTAMAAAPISLILLPVGIFLTFGFWEFTFRRAKKKNLHFVPVAGDEEALARGEAENAMPIWLAIAPIIILFILLNVFKLNTYLCFIIVIIITFALFWKYLPADKREVVNSGFGCATAIFGIMAAVGLGAVLQATSGFAAIQRFATTLGGNNPYWNLLISGNLITFALASGSGSLGVMATTIGKDAIAAGCSAEAVHRIITIISQGFDTLPHNGTTCMILGISRLDHKEGYYYMFITTLVIPLILSILATMLAIIIYPV